MIIGYRRLKFKFGECIMEKPIKTKKTKSAMVPKPIALPFNWVTDLSLQEQETNPSALLNRVKEMIGENGSLIVADEQTRILNQILGMKVYSPEAILEDFNTFDLPFGCQQPTAFHMELLGRLVKAVYLPETELEDVYSIVRLMYHNLSNSNMPNLYRHEDAKALPFYANWDQKYKWLNEMESESWWTVSAHLQKLGELEDAVLAHYQAMPTINNFEKILKELVGFVSTADGRWLPNKVTTSVQQLKNTKEFDIYSARINTHTTTYLLDSSAHIWLQLDGMQTVIRNTKTVERFLCTLLLIYRQTASIDVLKTLKNYQQNLYLGNAEFNIVDAVRFENVIAFHEKNKSPENVVFDKINIPLLSPIVQEMMVKMTLTQLSPWCGVVFGYNEQNAGASVWYETDYQNVKNLSWWCVSNKPEQQFASPIKFEGGNITGSAMWALFINPQ